MTLKIRQKTLIPNATRVGDLEVLNPTDPTPNTGVTLTQKEHVPVYKATLTLADFDIDMDSGDDFGGTKLVDLPTNNLVIVAVNVDLAATVSGLATNTVETVDFAVGTATTASTDFSNGGEDNLMEKVDGVGAAATGTIKGASGSDGGLGNVVLAAGSKAIYLNASSPVTTGTGTVTLDGTVEVFYMDLGDHS